MLNGSKYAMEKSSNLFHGEDVNVNSTETNLLSQQSNFMLLFLINLN